jgi:hypothetical protein
MRGFDKDFMNSLHISDDKKGVGNKADGVSRSNGKDVKRYILSKELMSFKSEASRLYTNKCDQVISLASARFPFHLRALVLPSDDLRDKPKNETSMIVINVCLVQNQHTTSTINANYAPVSKQTQKIPFTYQR